MIRAPADGYTLFLANGTNAVNATLFDNLRFDFVRDTAPIASINRIRWSCTCIRPFRLRPFPT
jgi:hypothetical protein